MTATPAARHRRFITDPITSRIYPVPAGGSTNDPPPEPPKPPGEPDPPKPPDPPGEATDWKAEARKWEKRAKDNSDAAARLTELEDANKTELQKAQDAAAAAEKAKADAESRALRIEVATSKGLTAGQAKRLSGATREELEADADELLAEFGGTGKPGPPPSGKPTPNPSGGRDPETEPEEMDPLKLAAKVPRI
ncbi:MAG TPA: hypothetical protein VGA36_09625 [Nitriliruptorales bacterium]